jgi:hypothetical protein
VLNRSFAVLFCTALAGCAFVPPAVSAVSFAADAVSYAFSGKSVSDHGLSMVMKQDCAMLKLVEGEAICKPGPHLEMKMTEPRDRDDRTLLAAIDSRFDGQEQTQWSRPRDADVLNDYATAGPLLEDTPATASALVLQPLTSGMIDEKAGTAIRLSSLSL